MFFTKFFIYSSILYWVTTNGQLLYPQFRIFEQSIIKVKQELINYLANEETQVAYIQLSPGKGGMLGITGMQVRDILDIVWTVRSHSVILLYKEIDKTGTILSPLKRSTTPQIWCYFDAVPGTDAPVPQRERSDLKRLLNSKTAFTRNQIMVVSWKRPHLGHNSTDSYTKANVDDMVFALRPGLATKTIVLCFDAILLSNTPQIIKWFPPEFNRLALLIRVFNSYKEVKYVNQKGLKAFVKGTKMGPIFFDMPTSLRSKLIEGLPQFTTKTPKIRSGAKRGCVRRDDLFPILTVFGVILKIA